MQCENDTFVEEINILNEKIKALEHASSSKDKTSKKTSGKVRKLQTQSQKIIQSWVFYLVLIELTCWKLWICSYLPKKPIIESSIPSPNMK